MPSPACAHCGAAIADRSTVVELDGRTYCCANCARNADETVYRAEAEGTCARCGAAIVDTTTLVEQAGMIFCCRNCAAAMAAGDQAAGPTH